MRDGQQGHHELERPCPTEQVAGHRLGGTENQVAGMIAEHRFDGARFGNVPDQGRGPVGVDIPDVGRVDVAILEALLDRPGRPFAAGWRRGDVIRVAAQAVADDFPEDRGAPGPRVFEALEHDDGTAVGQDEAVPAQVERAAGGDRIVVPERQRPHVGEGRHGQAGDGRLRATGYHAVGGPASDQVVGLANGIGRRGTGRYRTEIRPLEPEAHGDQASRHIRDEHGNEERRDAVRALEDVGGTVVLVRLHAPDAAADDHTGPIGVREAISQPGMFHSLLGGTDGVLDELVVAPCFLPGDVGLRIEVLDLAGEPHLQVGCIELGDWARARLAPEERSPSLLHGIADRADGSQPGHDYPAGQPTSRFFRGDNSAHRLPCEAFRLPHRGCRCRTPSRRP